MRKDQVFKTLVHVDSVEDLRFYHYPLEQLRTEGKVQVRDFHWLPCVPDGALDEEDLCPAESYCRHDRDLRHRPREDDDDNRNRGRDQMRGRNLFDGVSRWFDNWRRDMADNLERG
jgi:hypothetical protein